LFFAYIFLQIRQLIPQNFYCTTDLSNGIEVYIYKQILNSKQWQIRNQVQETIQEKIPEKATATLNAIQRVQ
jgi:hypothetical protein